MRDLAGYDDSDAGFGEIDTTTVEHLRQTVYRATATQRGSDTESVETQGRWAHLLSYLQTRTGSSLIKGAVAAISRNLTEADERIQRADVKAFIDGTVVRWTATVSTLLGQVTTEGEFSPLPPQPEPTPVPGPPIPVAEEGVRTFRQFITSSAWVPQWLLGQNRGRVLWSTGLTIDAMIEWLFMGIQQRFPDYCLPEALPWLCRDRGIQRGLVETNRSLRRRLREWLDAHRVRGTPYAILTQVQAYFAATQAPTDRGPICRIVEHHPHPSGASIALWTTISNDGELTFVRTSPSNWDWDSADPMRPASLDNRDPRFWIIIYQDPYAEGPFQMVETYPGEISLDDFVVTENNGIDLAQLGEFWKSAGSWCAGVIISHSESLFDPEGSGADYPDGTWHQYGDQTADYGPNRAQPALYLEMDNHINDVSI